MTLPFGKHKGEDLRDVPLDYLKWIESQDWLKDEMREEVQFEINRRSGDRPGMGKVVRKPE
jgi:uncharacterized protein (DUF3820 family)